MGTLRGAVGGTSRTGIAGSVQAVPRLNNAQDQPSVAAQELWRNTQYPNPFNGTPADLFANGEQGVWYDPSDFSTMWQDAGGTTPVTALGQPVGLILDKSRWDGRGVVNLLTRTEEFNDAAWGFNNATITANQTLAPTGTRTADLLSETNVLGAHNIVTATSISFVSGATYTKSVYVKKGSGLSAPDIVQITLLSTAFGAGQYANVNIVTGQVTFSIGGTASISDAGNGWWRITWTATATASASAQDSVIVFCQNNPTALRSPSYNGNTAANVFIWGAQLELGFTATAYQANGASVGGPGNHARQTGDAARPTVQARSNLLIRTEEFDDAYWGIFKLNPFGSGSVANTFATTDPLGGNTADYIQEDTSSDFHTIDLSSRTISVLGATVPYTFSVFVKAAERTKCRIAFYRSSSPFPTMFGTVDLTLGTITAGATGTAVVLGSSIENAGNGWYRCSITGYTNSSLTSHTPQIALLNDAGSLSYLGTGTSGLYIWGAQLELASAAGPYQRVTTATDYADIGLPRYLQFDGTDDSLVTAANLNMTATDEVTVCAGIFKGSNPTAANQAQMIVELSASLDVNNATFALTPFSSFLTPNLTFNFASRGTVTQLSNTTSTLFLAPNNFVASGISSINRSISTLRINGSVVAQNNERQGTGTYGNYLMYIGRRGGASLPFLGRIYQLIVRGAITGGKLLAQTERYVAEKTGLIL